jgi:phosphatidylserine/phosphatidylglycerophosphate/cardiolipin synthase-like enzyme
VKPLPAGTHVDSLAARLPEADVALIGQRSDAVADAEIHLIETAGEFVVVDQSPLPRTLAQALLLRKHAQPRLHALVITDARAEAFGGAPLKDLAALETAGITVVRVDLERLRDANPLYSGPWRLLVNSWSSAADEGNSLDDWRVRARHLNYKADERDVLIADDGAGGTLAIVGAIDSVPALEVRGAPARAMLDSELKVASWSDSGGALPALPGVPAPQPGTLDVRYLSEGAIGGALMDLLARARRGAQVDLAARLLSERRLIEALKAAAARGVSVRVLLDALDPNPLVAGELAESGVQLKWRLVTSTRTQLTVVRYPTDTAVLVSSADLSRRGLLDFNLESAVEIMGPQRSQTARAAADCFEAAWIRGTPQPKQATVDSFEYWRYRLLEATGLGGL